jgi:release factor glutamine methyltransferase
VVPVTASAALRESVGRRLAAAGCVAAAEEASELLAAAPDEATLADWLGRREAGVPLAWITGGLQFAGRAVSVDAGVYVPRVQTEELVRRACRLLRAARGPAVDLCTGSGAVAVSLAGAVAGATVIGVDIDRAAAACARKNGVPVVIGDLGGALRSGAFGLVTAVAPYVPTGALGYLPADVQRYEPRRALDGGEDGLAVVRGVILDAARLLRAGGWLLLEVGANQDEALAGELTRAGFDRIETWRDEDGDLRGVAARRTAGHLVSDAIAPSWAEASAPPE